MGRSEEGKNFIVVNKGSQLYECGKRHQITLCVREMSKLSFDVLYRCSHQKAIVGSYKGTCRFYNTVGNKLQLDGHINVRTENKKGRGKKITGLHVSFLFDCALIFLLPSYCFLQTVSSFLLQECGGCSEAASAVVMHLFTLLPVYNHL